MRLVSFIIAGTLMVSACTKPKLDAVLPDTGYPRQLLAIEGKVQGASVIWDVGGAEISIFNGLLGTRYFQIPVGAAPGVHTIALRNSKGTSDPETVTVLAASGTFPAPRLEEINILYIGSGTSPDASFTVSAANMDTDATIVVTGKTITDCWGWGGLPVDFQQAHVPVTFGYPIYHYNQKICIVQDVNFAEVLNFTITNTDGQSDSGTIAMPASLADLDSDADGLLNTWEDSGYTAPSGGVVALDTMGARKFRKTIPVEVDWVAAATPNTTIWATIENSFLDAPILNPNGSSGIDVLIDRGQGGAFTQGGTVLADHTTMDFGANASAGYVDFFTYKSNAANFNQDRLNVFHYSIFGRTRPNGSSGRAEVWGNDFMVTFSNFPIWASTDAQVGTFVHEFGHNLGLSHGDLLTTPTQWNMTRKQNFPTTMSYRYQFFGISLDCDFVSEAVHTFSQGALATLDEANVDESIGICDNLSLDLNADGSITNGPLDLTCWPPAPCNNDTIEILDDFDQWGNLIYDFDAPGSNWNGN